MSNGTLSLDRSAAYVVVLEETKLDKLEAVLKSFKARTLQEAIYPEVQRNVEYRFYEIGDTSMNDRDDTIAKIRNVLTTETNALRLSNRLFAPGGLFSKLFATPEEKIVVVDSPLFRRSPEAVVRIAAPGIGDTRVRVLNRS